MQFTRSLLHRLASLLIVAWFSLRRRVTNQDYRRLDRQAERIVDESLRDNVWRRSATPGRIAMFLLWGGQYPLRFAAIVGGFCVVIAAAFLPAPLPQLAFIPLPTLPSDYSHPSFFGALWSVQATLVALVYPFVLTFITVMLQRRAVSKIALSVYLLDSAVLPAGTSSFLLLAVLTVEYFLLVVAPHDLFLAASVFNGGWFLANVALTGFFLAKTIRYLEDEVGQQAYRNLAVSLVLREELKTSLSQHLMFSAAERLQWQPSHAVLAATSPRVQFFSMSKGKGQAARSFNRASTLTDVHLGALQWVSERWLARARGFTSSQGGPIRSPVLQFKPTLHSTSIGRIELCSVVDGPDLRPLEVAVVSRAFCFGTRPRKLVAGSTVDMLEELAAEVQSLLEQGRHDASRQAFYRMLDLHVGLLEACHEAPEVEGDVSSAAGLVTSPFAWGGRTLNSTWLHPYRELIFAAVERLERDQTLLSALAYAASRVVAASELQPPQLVVEIFSLPKLLDHALASWWLKAAQRTGGTPEPEGYALPQPSLEDYRKAIVTLVGGLSGFRYASTEERTEPPLAWKQRCRAARAWAAHVDLSATLLLDAVARGDGVAAEWYCDNLSAWWANHQYELDPGRDMRYEPGLSEVRLGITELAWPVAEQRLSKLANRSVGIEEAEHVVWHAVYRYWEAMRMVVCLQLLQQAESGAFHILAARVSANLARHQLFQGGPRAEGLDLTDPDELLSLFVETCFADSWVRGRLDSFCEARDRWTSDRAPVVSGWMYSGSGGATDVRSKVLVLSQMLLAAQPRARETWRKTLDVLAMADIDLQVLAQVDYLMNTCISTCRQKSFRSHLPLVDSLRGLLGKAALVVPDRLSVFRGYVRVREDARTRRTAGLNALVVAQKSVDELAKRLSAAMSVDAALSGSYAFCRVEVGTASSGNLLNATGFKFTKENLTDPPLDAIADSHIEHLAKEFMNYTSAHLLHQFLTARGIAPIAHPDDVSLLKNIDAAATKLRLIGLHPAVVVSQDSAASKALRPYEWDRLGLPSLPAGIQLSYRKSGVCDFAAGFVNDTPVLSLSTPVGAAFILPLEWIAKLVLEPSLHGVVITSHSVTGTNEVSVDFQWQASLQSA